MFEKEAEDNKPPYAYCALDTKCELWKDGFQKGAEFGYQKGFEFGVKSNEKVNQIVANEWHYPSKGEYPKECENVWCYCKGMGIKFCSVGHTIVGGDNKVRWWANNKTEELRVIAWKEIVLPKESE